MPEFARFVSGVISKSQLEIARKIYDDACQEFAVGADESSVRLALAEIVLATIQMASGSADKAREAARSVAAQLGKIPRGERE